METSKTKCFPLWIDSYHADTLELSAEEHGAYLLLLMAMWISPAKSLPNDTVKLALIAKCPLELFIKVWPNIERYFVSDGIRITNSRLIEEAEKREKASENGKKGAKTRWGAPSLHLPIEDEDPLNRQVKAPEIVIDNGEQHGETHGKTIASLNSKLHATDTVNTNVLTDNINVAYDSYKALAKRVGLPIPRERKGDGDRRKKLKKVISVFGMESFSEALTKIEGSAFLRGEKDFRGATLDWILKPVNLRKILEGNYDDRITSTDRQSGGISQNTKNPRGQPTGVADAARRRNERQDGHAGERSGDIQANSSRNVSGDGNTNGGIETGAGGDDKLLPLDDGQ